MSSAKGFVFLGSKRLGLRTLKTVRQLRPGALLAIVTFDDAGDSRSVLSEFKLYADEYGIPLKIARNPRDAEQIIKSFAPDLLFVVCWYWMLNSALLSSIPRGAIGVHNSLLPQYRGGSPLVWAIINGEKYVGFSAFSMTSAVDAGPIWFQERIQLTSDMSIRDALAQIESQLLNTLESSWCKLLDGDISPRQQDENGASYCAQRTESDGRIDWSLPARRVVDFIRAQSDPYPGAFTETGSERVVIFSALVWPYIFYGVPGQISRVTAESVLIICGENTAISVERVYVGGIERPAGSVFNSIKIRL